ncbi:MAG: nucleoside hydrolase [Spirochaetales bacterium]|nr:nucleoside hydrolase [Spirochaetales bacterium]
MKILLDCDPGHDDMMAIMLACAHPQQLELLGITTVAGNQTGDKTWLNARRILTLIGRTRIPVARGADRPLVREMTTAPAIHGSSGLEGAELPEPATEGLPVHAVDFLIDALRASPEPVTLVPTGPLTNVALALRKDPGIVANIQRIVLMGGAVFDSNVTPAAEFNIYVDPEAARIVFTCGAALTMVGLDVTNKAFLTFDEIEEVSRWSGRVSTVVAPLLGYFARANREVFGFEGAPLHDALAVAHLLRPGVIRTKFLNVEIETAGELTRGRTVVDVRGVTGRRPNAEVALEVDRESFRDLIFEAVRILDGA